MLPVAWPDARFEINPDKIAAAETRMWKSYYSRDLETFRQELVNLLQGQFGISPHEAQAVGEPFAGAVMRFESAGSRYQHTVLPSLKLAYSHLKQKVAISFDPEEAAEAELDWWVARRTPGKDSVEAVGRLIARFYTTLFGDIQPAFERAGLLRAQAAHRRDKGGAQCDWNMVEQLLRESYQALREGLKHTINNSTAQIALIWAANTEDNLAGYKIYYGTYRGQYDSCIDVGNQTNYIVTDLENGKTYYFVITAYNTDGEEGGYSTEIIQEATVDSMPPLPQRNTIEEYGSQPRIDLTKNSRGPFTVKVQVVVTDREDTLPVFPRIQYFLGTGDSYGYLDMINEGNNVWRFDIPDPNWYKYMSKHLHYQVTVFDGAGKAIIESSWKKELIDSFVQNDD